MSETHPENTNNHEPSAKTDSKPPGEYNYHLSDGYRYVAERNHKENTPINQELVHILTGEAQEMLAQGLSGTDVAERLGLRIMLDQQLRDLSRIILREMADERDTEQPADPLPPPWDNEEVHNARYEVIASLEDDLSSRNRVYQRITDNLLENGFSYRDVLGDRAVRADTHGEHARSAARYANELARLSLTESGEKLRSATQDIRWQFNRMRAMLPGSVQLSQFADSESWILWDIGKQEALKDKDYRSEVDWTVSYSGSVVDNPPEKGGSEKTNFMRRVVAWRHLGWELYTQIANGADTNWLEPYLNTETRELLDRSRRSDHTMRKQLHANEYTDLGRGIDNALLENALQENTELTDKAVRNWVPNW